MKDVFMEYTGKYMYTDTLHDVLKERQINLFFHLKYYNNDYSTAPTNIFSNISYCSPVCNRI